MTTILNRTKLDDTTIKLAAKACYGCHATAEQVDALVAVIEELVLPTGKDTYTLEEMVECITTALRDKGAA